jgi:AcrR family transcriptional regulator
MVMGMAPPASKTARQRYARGEGDRLRLDLLQAAAELMATHGSIERISLRAVARQAGVSPTAVYRHFDDHLALLRDSIDYCWTNFLAVINDAKNSSDDPFLAFKNTGDAYVDFALKHQGQYRVLFTGRLDTELGVEPPASSLSAFEVLVELIAAILDANADDRDAAFVAVQAHTWIHGIVELGGGQPHLPWPEPPALLAGLAEALQLAKPATR